MIDQFIAGLASGDSKAVLMEDGKTVLLTIPESDPFDPKTGQKKPPVDRGVQIADLEAWQVSADKDLADAQERLDAATRKQSVAYALTELATEAAAKFDSKQPAAQVIDTASI